jgi:hypothetical protein
MQKLNYLDFSKNILVEYVQFSLYVVLFSMFGGLSETGNETSQPIPARSLSIMNGMCYTKKLLLELR